MIERVLFTLLLLAAAILLYATYNLTVVTLDLIPQIAQVLEAVAIIEDAATHTVEAMGARDASEAEQACAEERGEWHPDYGCFLQELVP